MLPLFHEHAQSVAMICHAMDIVHASVTVLNPHQVPVIAFDQPLYTLAKLIQWNWPDTHDEGRFVVMFGGLHVEMAALKVLGSLLEGSGWVEAISEAGIVTAGSAEGLLSASNARRSRRAHEITLAALHILQHVAFEKLGSADVSFKDWCEQQRAEHKQFAFWCSVMKLQSAVLVFVRALREANFDLYVQSLIELLPWFFVLDCTHYARWLSIHVHDMQQLADNHPEVFSAFQKGKFTVYKSERKFSAMPIDQAHEQLNASVKGDGGVIGLTQNDTALHRWIVYGPEVARLLSEFEAKSILAQGSILHHEQQLAAQQSFVNDVKSLVSTFERFGNPFEDQSDLIVLHSRRIVTADIADCVGRLFDIGKQQYDKFVDDRLIAASETLFTPVKKNKLTFFVTPKAPSTSHAKLIACRNDSALFSRLFIACQVRGSDLEEFFAHENQVYPPALSVAGSLHFGNKSDLLICLETVQPAVESVPDHDALIVDGSALVNMLKPGTSRTFLDYADKVFMPSILSHLAKVHRVDVVWDLYDAMSIKNDARLKKRSYSARQQVSAMAPIPNK